MKVSLTAMVPVTDAAAFHWHFAACMLDVMKSMLTLHQGDMDEAVVFMALSVRELAPVIAGGQGPDEAASLVELTLHLNQHEAGTRLGELARFARMNRTTVRRRLDSLIARGMVVCDDGVHFRLAPNLSQDCPEFTTMLFKHWMLIATEI